MNAKVEMRYRDGWVTTENAGGGAKTFNFLEAWRKAGKFHKVSFGDRGPGGSWNSLKPEQVQEFIGEAAKAGVGAVWWSRANWPGSPVE